MMDSALLQNRRVLVVEDEYMIAEAMSRNLRRAGATVLGPVSDVDEALALLDAQVDVDAAVLDINLGDQKVYPVVDVLLARGARCVFATGNDAADVPAAYSSMMRCEKPIEPSCIVEALTGDGSLALSVRPANRAVDLGEMRDQLLRQIEVADAAGESLLAVKLCEALDVLEGSSLS